MLRCTGVSYPEIARCPNGRIMTVARLGGPHSTEEDSIVTRFRLRSSILGHQGLFLATDKDPRPGQSRCPRRWQKTLGRPSRPLRTAFRIIAMRLESVVYESGDGRLRGVTKPDGQVPDTIRVKVRIEGLKCAFRGGSRSKLRKTYTTYTTYTSVFFSGHKGQCRFSSLSFNPSNPYVAAISWRRTWVA